MTKRVRNSFFFVPTLLIATFLLFIIIPDLISLFLLDSSTSPILEGVIILCINIGILSDAIIYIFFIPDVRKWCLDKIFCVMQTPRERQVTYRSSRTLRESVVTVV